MEKVRLTTKKELEIYMNPVRQQLLRQLEISKTPMTPKMLADKLGISASGVQHHIRKLISLGVILLDHTEQINGITASFYKPAEVTVQIGLDLDDNASPQREVLIQQRISKVYEGFLSAKKSRVSQYENPDPELLRQWGDIMNGVVHLTEQESGELMRIISEYIESHAKPASDRSPWEYSLILYNTEEELND